VQYKEVGTRLTVMPSISEDGTVHLDVTQEVSNATAETAFDAPVISTRSVQTQLLVRDGQTAVLGGLADRQREVNRVGLPVLSSIPLIGGLFGSNQRRTTETELFVFITPRVVRSDEDAARVTTPLRDRIVPPER
jgi:general secretion pathway protein D